MRTRHCLSVEMAYTGASVFGRPAITVNIARNVTGLERDYVRNLISNHI